ncbi:MAG TPA: alpha amylase C-terminal domain-containing protein, partial [Verrucomicrobiae bacterium]
WVDCSDRENNVLSFLRQTPDGQDCHLIIMNLTPVPRPHYRLGVPQPGFWQELLNSDAHLYAGSNSGNGGGVQAQTMPLHGQAASAEFFLPPLSVSVFAPRAAKPQV